MLFGLHAPNIATCTFCWANLEIFGSLLFDREVFLVVALMIMFFTKVVHEFWQLFRYEVLKLQKTSVSEVPFMFSSTRLISRRFSVQHYNPWVHVHDCTLYNKMMPAFWHFDIAIDRGYCFNLFARYTSKWKYIDFFPVKALRLFQILFTNFQPSQSFRWMKADLKKKTTRPPWLSVTCFIWGSTVARRHYST